MDCSMPGLLVYHQRLGFTQTHVQWVGDNIQQSHPMWSPSHPTFNLSQHQDLFKWVSSSHSVQFSSVIQLCPTLCDPMNCSTPGLPVHHQLLGACSNSCPSGQWCHPTISSSVIPFSSHLQSFPASGSFQMSFSFSMSPSNEYSGLISFRIDWLDLFAVQETLKWKQLHPLIPATVLFC